MIDTSREAIFKRVPYIWYLVQFYRKNDKNKNKDVKALINSCNKVNAIHPAYTTKLGLHAGKINVGTQKINGSHLDNFRMVIADYSVKDNLGGFQFL